MSGYLFNLSQGSGDVYVARGNLLVYGTNDWNLATSMGVYEVLASEYASYINAGPLVQNGLLQVNRCGLRCTQIVSYSGGSVYSRSTENVLLGAWTTWIMLSNVGGSVPVGGPVPVGSVSWKCARWRPYSSWRTSSSW